MTEPNKEIITLTDTQSRLIACDAHEALLITERNNGSTWGLVFDAINALMGMYHCQNSALILSQNYACTLNAISSTKIILNMMNHEYQYDRVTNCFSLPYGVISFGQFGESRHDLHCYAGMQLSYLGIDNAERITEDSYLYGKSRTIHSGGPGFKPKLRTCILHDDLFTQKFKWLAKRVMMRQCEPIFSESLLK